MENYLVIQAHTVFLFLSLILLIAICSYAWTSWRVQARRIKAERPRAGFSSFIRHWTTRAFSKEMSLIRYLRSRSSLAGEWLAPLIAWVAVFMTFLAILGLLFGDNSL